MTLDLFENAPAGSPPGLTGAGSAGSATAGAPSQTGMVPDGAAAVGELSPRSRQDSAAAPEPGSYEAIKAVNWSTLKWLGVSPLHYLHRLRNPEKRKEVFARGGATHCLILEPEEFDSRFGIFDGKRDPRTRAWQDWLAANPGKTQIRTAQLEQARGMAAAVRDHKVAWSLLMQSRKEESIVWTDPGTGIKCKGRADLISPVRVPDIKTTRSVVAREIAAAVARYSYHCQLAMYHDGAVAAHKIRGDVLPALVFVEATPPHDVAVYELPIEAIRAGRVAYRGLLRLLAQCLDADWWPGVAPEMQTLELPSWAEGVDPNASIPEPREEEEW